MYFRYSVQLKYAVTYIVLILAILTFINIFPVIRFREMLFEAKYASVQSQIPIVASSLSSLTKLDPAEVSRVMELLVELKMTRIIVVGTDMRIVYDSSDNEGNAGKLALFSEISRALSGKDVYYAHYSGNALTSRAAVPVMYGGNIIGALFVYDYETEQATLITALRYDLIRVSFLILFVTLVLAFVFSLVLTRRIRSILRAIKNVRGGSYDYRARVRGGDELAELAREFNLLVERLQKMEEMRARFVSDASHELKTPLAGIKLLTDSIVQNEDMDSATVREFVNDIGAEADRLSRITERLLELTRLDSVKNAKKNAVDMKDIIEKSLRLLASIAAERNVRLEASLDERCRIYANSDDVHQAVFNIIENAIKYNKDGGSVTLLLFKRDKTVRFIVDDTGIGIPAQDLPYVFDRFYRVDKARNRAAGGSGLGLAIVKEIIAKHGGTVSASARENGGCRFEVSFPALK